MNGSKKKQGAVSGGISINGHNPAKASNTYETCIVETKNLFNIVKPFRLKVESCLRQGSADQPEKGWEQRTKKSGKCAGTQVCERKFTGKHTNLK